MFDAQSFPLAIIEIDHNDVAGWTAASEFTDRARSELEVFHAVADHEARDEQRVLLEERLSCGLLGCELAAVGFVVRSLCHGERVSRGGAFARAPAGVAVVRVKNILLCPFDDRRGAGTLWFTPQRFLYPAAWSAANGRSDVSETAS